MPFKRAPHFLPLASVLTAVLTLSLVVSTASASVVIDVDFGASGRSLPYSQKISGTLPSEVKEDSAWADLRIDYEAVADRLGSNLRWTRVNLTELRKGQGQLKWVLPEMGKSATFRGALTAASETETRMTMTVMQTVPPYNILWFQDITLPVSRETFRFDIQVKDSDKPLGFFLQFPEVGQYDLYSLSLEQINPEQLEAERAAAAAAAPDNLLTQSGFPLGLTSGWSTGRTNSLLKDVRFEPGAKDDPNGNRPLHIRPEQKQGWTLYSPPVTLPDPSALHALQFLVRGEGTGKVRLLADGKPIPLERSFGGSEEFTQVVVPFRPDELAHYHVIEWTGEGEIEISSLMINHSKTPKDFTRQLEADLAINGKHLNGQVFVEGVDTPKLYYHATGLTAPATLMTQVTDLYGSTQPARVVEIDPSHPGGSVELADLGLDLAYGSYRVESVLVRDGQPVSPFAEVVLHHVRKPHFWGRVAPESKFGNHFHYYEPHLYGAKAIGVNWNRFHGGNGGVTYWSGVEPQQGEWRWHTEKLRDYRDAGFALIGVWTHVPLWARSDRDDVPGGWLDNWWQPADYAQFGDYVEQSAQAYSGLIDAWQIWNEPWGEFWFKEWRGDLQGTERWHRGDTPKEDFVKLSKVAWERSREVLPENFPILGIGATVGDRGKDWMQDLLGLDVHQYANVVSYHAYFGGEYTHVLDAEGSNRTRLDERILEPIAAHPAAAAMPLWMTEGNWFPRKNRVDSGLYKHTVGGMNDPLTLVRHNAVRLPLYHAMLLSTGTHKIFSYALNGGSPYFRAFPPAKIDWSSMVTQSGELHPAATVYAAMTYFLEPASHHETIPFSNTQSAFVFAAGAEAAAGSLALLFSPDAQTFLGDWAEQHAGIQILDFLGNPTDGRIQHDLLYLVAPTLTPTELTGALKHLVD